ncbi:MAG: hypothetical protein SGARI_007710, partial [Bacillariaceae sp.]
CTDNDDEIKSPYTNAAISSSKLLDAKQTRNTIETLIENGVIKGEIADKWLERVNYIKNLLEKAEGGDPDAMATVAGNFVWGDNDFLRDFKMAYEWSKRAHAAGSIVGTAYLGSMLQPGCGVEQNQMMGTMYLGLAAGAGSNYAAYLLGTYLSGRDGDQAIRLLECVVNNTCKYDHLPARLKEVAQQTLARLKEESAAGN